MNLLELENLSKSFGGLAASTNVTADIKEGEIVGMIGPNGAGKTTLFNLISGTYLRIQGRFDSRGRRSEGRRIIRSLKEGYAGLIRL